MNRRKGFKLLIVVLFFAFISLISRSIIYLILSVAIASIILFLLSGDRKNRKVTDITQKNVPKKDVNKGLNTFLFVIAIFGGLILGYGSLFFMNETIFHHWITLPDQLIVALVLIFLGFGILLSSLFFIIKEVISSK
jgi:uncharacterized membrane protein